MGMADKRARALQSVDHVRMIEAKNSPTYPTSVYYSVLQRSQLRSASSDVVNLDLTPVLDEKGIVAFEKSRSYSSFAFSCNRTPVTAMSFPAGTENMVT